MGWRHDEYALRRKAARVTQDSILKMMANGLTRKEIAANMSITVKGVEWHWSQIVIRFGVPDPFRIALKARTARIV